LPNEPLWAPWRSNYVQGNRTDDTPRSDPRWLPGADESCFLCRYAGTPADDQVNHVVWRGTHMFAVLNRYPYNAGHVMVAPLSHLAALPQLSDAAHLEAMHVLGRLTVVMQEKMNAAGFNVGLNLGKVAGAGVPGHLHWHLVPRWQGDANFMHVVSETPVISATLDALWEMLSDALSGS